MKHIEASPYITKVLNCIVGLQDRDVIAILSTALQLSIMGATRSRKRARALVKDLHKSMLESIDEIDKVIPLRRVKQDG